MADKKTKAAPGKRRDGTPVRKGIKGPSTTGKGRSAQVDQTNWRTRMQTSKVKFDDQQKEIYLEVLAETGHKGRAAEAAGVCNTTVLNHKDADEEFSEACDEALDKYRYTIRSEIVRRGREGVLKPIIQKGVQPLIPAHDEAGRPIMRRPGSTKILYFEEWGVLSKEEVSELEHVLVPAFVREFSDNLLLAEARRVDPEYRDKSAIDLTSNGEGGVLVAPPYMSPEEWVKKQEKLNESRKPPEGAFPDDDDAG